MAVRSLALVVLTVGLTFSYAILDAILPDTVPVPVFARMSLWTLAVLSSYAAYSRATTRRLVPQSIRWTPQSRWSVVAPAAVGILAALAVIFPSPRHDRFDMLYIVAIAVIGEEVLFRGLLWDLMDGWAGERFLLGLSGTVWLTALAFGLMHLQYHHFQLHWASIVQVAYAFAVGIPLGVLRRRTGSVASAILAHSTFNSLLNLFLAAAS